MESSRVNFIWTLICKFKKLFKYGRGQRTRKENIKTTYENTSFFGLDNPNKVLCVQPVSGKMRPYKAKFWKVLSKFGRKLRVFFMVLSLFFFPLILFFMADLLVFEAFYNGHLKH